MTKAADGKATAFKGKSHVEIANCSIATFVNYTLKGTIRQEPKRNFSSRSPEPKQRISQHSLPRRRLGRRRWHGEEDVAADRWARPFHSRTIS